MRTGPKLVPEAGKKRPSELQKLLAEAKFLRAHWVDLERRIAELIQQTAA